MDQPATEPANDSDALPPKRLRLDRVRNALRHRDWLGIAIELAVVVVGILIAFQVDQWGDQRAKAREERQFLERLFTEYQTGLAELKAINTHHIKVIGDIRIAFARRADPAGLESLARIESFGCRTARFPNASFNDTAFEELLSSGRLNLISDQRLRGQIRSLATAQAAANKQVGGGRELVLNQVVEIAPYQHFDLMPDGELVCFMRWRELLKDPLATYALLRAYRTHQLALAERRKVMSLTQRAVRGIACRLGKPECRVATSPPS